MRRILIITLVAVVATIAGVAWFLSRGDVAESVRFRVVQEANRALGREVTVRRVGGDPVRGVVLEGVRIGNPPQLPRGSFFEAPRAIVRFDAGRLAADLFAGRGIASSIVAIELDRPFLVLSRDMRGRWNYADLFERKDATAQVPAFRGTVVVREGALVFSDALSIGTPFGAHFDRITGTIEFADAPRMRVSVDAVNTDGDTPALLHAVGRATIGEGTFDFDLSARGASSAFWGPYLVRLPWLLWRGGTFDGTMHLLASRWGKDIVLDYRGRLVLRSGQALLLPQRTLLSEINGPLVVDNTGVATDGLSMTAGSPSVRGRVSPVWMRGTITHVAGVYLDLAVRSSSLDLATLQRLVFPRAAVRLQGRADGDARIVGSIQSPRIEGRITGAAGQLNRQGFADARGDFSYYGGLLIFDRVSLAAGRGQLDGYLQLDTRDRTFFALARARSVDTRMLPGFGLTIDPSLRGSATGVVAAAGSPGGVIAQGRVEMGPGQALGVRFDRMETLFGYDRGRIDVDRLLARSGASTVHAYGNVSRTGALAIRLSADEVSLRTVGERFGLRGQLSGRADVTGELRGTIGVPRLTAELSARNGRLGPFPFDSAFGLVEISPARIATPGLRLRDGTGRYEAAGSIRWNGTGRFDLTMQAEDVPAQRLLQVAEVPLDVQGTVRGRVHLSGPVERPLLAGSIELRDGRVEGQQMDRAEAEFRWTGTHLLLDRAVASVNSSAVEAQGSVSRSGALSMTFSASAFRLRDIEALRTDAVDVDGTVDLAGTLSGTLRTPTVNAAVSSTSLVLNGQRFDRADGRVQYRAQRLTLNPLELQHGQGSFRLTGTVQLQDDPRVDLRVTARGAEASSLLNLARVQPPFALSGTLDGELTVSGALSNPRVTINVTLRDGRIGDHPIRDALVEARLADQALTLDRFVLHPEQGELIGAGRIDLRGDSDVEFAGQGLSLDLLRPLLRIRRPLEGTLEFTLQLSGRLADPNIGVSATVTDGLIGSTGFDQLILQALYRDGQFQISPAVLQEGGHRARLEGSVPFNPARFRFDETRPMDLRLTLADLSVLGLLTDAVEQAEGALAGEVRLSGTVSRPKIEGTLTTTDGSIKLTRIDPALTEVRGAVTFVGDEMRIDQLTARMGEGTLTASGSVRFSNFRPDRLQLQLAAEGARLNYDPHFAGQVDGMLRIEGTAAQPLVAGSLVLSHGDVVIGETRRTVTTGPNATGLNPVLNVDLQAGDELWVNIGDLRLLLHGTVHAAGTWRDPRLSGEATAERGNFTAFDTTFTLTEARATFAEIRGLTPSVDATAETVVRTSIPDGTNPDGTPRTRIETVTIFIHIEGTPDNLNVTYSSDPELAQEEIRARLASQARLFQVLRGDVPLERALRAELSAALFGPIGREVARALGLEEFIIQYDFEQPLQLRIGKLLISNLYVTLTSEFGVNPRYIWSLEYRLSPNTQISFSVDNQQRFDLLYVVKYRF